MVVQPFRVAGMVVNMFQRAAVAIGPPVRGVRPARPRFEDAPQQGPSRRTFVGDISRFAASTVSRTTRRSDSRPSPTFPSPSLAASPSLSWDASAFRQVDAAQATRAHSLDTPNPEPYSSTATDVRDYPLAQLRAQVAHGAARPVPVRRAPARQPHLRRSRPEALDRIWHGRRVGRPQAKPSRIHAGTAWKPWSASAASRYLEARSSAQRWRAA